MIFLKYFWEVFLRGSLWFGEFGVRELVSSRPLVFCVCEKFLTGLGEAVEREKEWEELGLCESVGIGLKGGKVVGSD